MKNFFQDNLNIVINERKKVMIFFLIFIVLISAISIVHTFLFIQKNSYLVDGQLNIIISRIPFNWGPLIENIYSNFEFTQPGYNFEFYLKKFPLNALFLAMILKVSKNIYFFMLIKNMFSSSLIFYFTYMFSKNNHKTFLLFLFLLIGFFIIPYNTYIIFNFVYGDHLTSFLVPLLFLSLVSTYQKNYFVIGILIFILYFIKPSMFFICLAIPFFIIFLEKEKNNYKKFIPSIFLLIAIFSWGTYGLLKTNHFPFGKNLLSNNSYDFSAITNKQFIKLYPNIGVDELVHNKSTIDFLNSSNFNNEWEYYDYFNQKNKVYLKDNLHDYLKTIPKKIYFIFFNIRSDNLRSDYVKINGNPIRYSNIFNKLSLNTAFIISMFILIKNFQNILNYKLEVYYLSLLSLNLLPHIYAWATNKHLVSVFVISNLYLILKLCYSRKYFNKIN